MARLFVWEILHSTIRKMDKHVQKIQQELEGAKDKLEKQQHKRVKPHFTPEVSAMLEPLRTLLHQKCFSAATQSARFARLRDNPVGSCTWI